MRPRILHIGRTPYRFGIESDTKAHEGTRRQTRIWNHDLKWAKYNELGLEFGTGR